jgi:hypothetical protein
MGGGLGVAALIGVLTAIAIIAMLFDQPTTRRDHKTRR